MKLTNFLLSLGIVLGFISTIFENPRTGEFAPIGNMLLNGAYILIALAGISFLTIKIITKK